MEPLRLSFEISFPTFQGFIDYWSSRYADVDRDARLYEPYIGLAKLTSAGEPGRGAVVKLFQWKNGGDRISDRKRQSIEENYLDCWFEDAGLEVRYLDATKGGGPVWNIFYLHCRLPDRYAIFDQHAYRAMLFLRRQVGRELTRESPAVVYELYLKTYLPFVKSAVQATHREMRQIDRALYTFGQFLKVAGPFS